MTEDERIRERAYDIWEREGRPENKHIEHWEQARRELEAETRVGGGEEEGAGAGGVVPGPDSGLQNPPSASERTLREAAEHLRGAARHDDQHGGQHGGQGGAGHAGQGDSPAEREWVREG